MCLLNSSDQEDKSLMSQLQCKFLLFFFFATALEFVLHFFLADGLDGAAEVVTGSLQAFDVFLQARFIPGDTTDLLCCWGLRESCVLSVNEEELVGFRGRMGLELCEGLIN